MEINRFSRVLQTKSKTFCSQIFDRLYFSYYNPFLFFNSYSHILTPNHVTRIYFLYIMCIRNRSFTHSTLGSNLIRFSVNFPFSSFTFYSVFRFHSLRYIFNDYVYKQTINSDDIKFQPKRYIILLIIQIEISYHPLVVLYTLC